MEPETEVVAAAAESSGQVPAPPVRRQHYRHRIQCLAYIQLDHANGGIIRDLSQDGLAIQAVAPLRVEQPIHVRFELLKPRVHIEANGRVAWANERGKAGVQFVDLPSRSRRVLNDWIFLDLLTIASGAAWTDSPIFRKTDPGEERSELIFSAAPRPAIRLEPPVATAAPAVTASQTGFELSWWPGTISVRALSRLIDGLILLSSVLLFVLVVVVTANTLPAWPAALGLGAGVAGFFGVAYYSVFRFLGGGTPGARLAKLATDHSEDKRDEEASRFR